MTEILLALLILVFAPQITWIFTWSKESAAIVDELILFLRIIWLMLPTVAFGMLSSALFQGVGKGLNALAMTVIRTLVFTVPLAWLLGVYLNEGLQGVWRGMMIAGLAYIPVAFGWAILFLRKLTRTDDGLRH